METIKEFFKELAKYLADPSLMPSLLYDAYNVSRIIFIIISLAFIVVIVFVLARTTWLKFRFIENVVEFVKFKPYGVNRFASDWKKIMKRIDSGIEAEYKLAVIEADNALDDALKQMGYIEETIEEKIKKVTKTEIPGIDILKKARETRNDVVRNPDLELTQDKAKEVLGIYEKTFRDIGLL